MRKIGPPLTDKEREAFVVAAQSCVGVRFRHQGRSRQGMDCVGLAAFCMELVGRPLIDIPAYSREPVSLGAELRAALLANLGEPLEPIEPWRVGDIALMKFGTVPSHIAIIVPHPDYPFGVIHAYGRKRKVVEHGLDAEWRNRIVEVYRP